MNMWPGRHRLEVTRQWPALVALVDRVEELDVFDGLVVVGSFAAGSPDELSDLDVVLVARSGEFERAWEVRHQLSRGALARWDLQPGSSSAGHNWLTRDLVKIDATILDPDGGEKPLAAPFVVCVGQPEVAARFPTASIEDVRERARQVAAEQNSVAADPGSMPYGELIDWKISEFKNAVRRGTRP
jgi:hypothetical protein